MVVDGDTLRVAGQTVRLWGVDAFEGGQTCGRSAAPCGDAATAYMLQLTAGAVVTCRRRGNPDRWGRLIAVCRVGSRDLGEAMVRSGHALDYRRYSAGAYATSEASARRESRGAWATGFVAPWDWRAGR